VRKNTTGQYVAFQAISKTDGSDVILGTPVVYYTIDGGTQAQTTATAVHEGNGQWSVALSQAETNGDHIVFSFVLTGAVTQTVNVYTLDADLTNLDVAVSTRSIFDASTDTVTTDAASRTASQADVSSLATAASIAGLNDFDPVNDVVARVTLVDTTTSNTDMRGTDGANTIAPDNASIAAILTDTGTTIPASISALNNFDPATDQVIVSQNNDKTGYALSSAANDAIGAAFLAYTLTKGSPGTIERAFWQSLKATQLADGEVSGTPTASAFDTNLTAVSGAYDHLLILFTSGSLAGEARPIDSYSATNGRITLQEPLTAAPSSADEFIVVPDHTAPTSEIVNDIFNEAQSGYTTPGTFGYYIDAQISGISSGGGDASEANQTTIISHLTDIKGGTFSGSTDSLEAIRDRGDAAWTTGGTSGSGLYQVTVTVEDASNNALQGARIAVDGTNLILTTPSNGTVTFNLDSGVYLLTCSPPAGYDTPTDVVVSVSTSDVTAEFTLTPTSSASCDVPWIG